MANTERYLRGPQSLVEMTVGSYAIEKGDFVCVVTGLAVPAGSVADGGDAAANREAVADIFVGIAQNAAAASGKVIVDTSIEAVYKLTLQTAADVSFSDLIEIYATTAAAADQMVVAGSTSPVAVCVKDHPTAEGTSIECKLLPSKLLGTPQS